LRTLVKKTPELAEETSPRGKTWHNLDQGTPNGEERRVVVRLIKTAHEIHYRRYQWRINGNNLRDEIMQLHQRLQNTTAQ
jgi:hypothetical protein